MLSELAREALTRRHTASEDGPAARPYGFRPPPHRGPGVSDALDDRLREDEPE